MFLSYVFVSAQSFVHEKISYTDDGKNILSHIWNFGRYSTGSNSTCSTYMFNHSISKSQRQKKMCYIFVCNMRNKNI